MHAIIKKLKLNTKQDNKMKSKIYKIIVIIIFILIPISSLALENLNLGTLCEGVGPNANWYLWWIIGLFVSFVVSIILLSIASRIQIKTKNSTTNTEQNSVSEMNQKKHKTNYPKILSITGFILLIISVLIPICFLIFEDTLNEHWMNDPDWQRIYCESKDECIPAKYCH